MARAAIAAGADGVMVEVHPDPDHARSDGDQSVAVDMTITADGDCRGTMSYLGSGGAEVLRADDRIMVRPEAGFLVNLGIDNAAQFLDYLDGRWLELTSDRDQFSKVCDLDEFLERDGRAGATATNEGVVTQQGEQAVVEVVEQDGGGHAKILRAGAWIFKRRPCAGRSLRG